MPTVEDIQQIVKIDDPIIRNLQITFCYHELSDILAQRTGLAANWCTFATWASKQAGQTIRKEDLARLLETRIKYSHETLLAVESVAATTGSAGAQHFIGIPEQALRAKNFTNTIGRASDAVSRGNKKVFEEIGQEFARFHETVILDQSFDNQKINHFCEQFRPGLPPEGQSYLGQAFRHYYQAIFEQDTKARAELILLANIEIGFHEQTRLQPEITESLDSGSISFFQFTGSLFTSIFPFYGWFKLIHLYLRRMLRRPTALDLSIQALLHAVQGQLRQIITDLMMAISLPSGAQLSLNKDLASSFPDNLKQITNPDLKHFLENHDPTPDSTLDSGALDWADLPDRIHFIIDFFRCFQENQDLLTPPFTFEQTQALKDGRLPKGRL
jgi:hypothetical protein